MTVMNFSVGVDSRVSACEQPRDLLSTMGAFLSQSVFS